MKVTFVLIIAWALVLAAEAFGSDSAAAKEARDDERRTIEYQKLTTGVIVAQGKVQDFLKTEQSKCGAARQLQIGPDGRVRCIVPPPPPPPPPAKPEPPKEEKK